MSLLKIDNLSKHFGGLRALDKINLTIEAGKLHSIIGPNGAGKTTLLCAISGLYRPTEGRVLFNGRDVTKQRVDKRVSLGITRTFQSTILFKEKTVIENIIIGSHLHTSETFVGSLLGIPTARKEKLKTEQRAVEIAESMGLADWSDKLASELPHGLQRNLGVCIGLATDPELLMLDEPVTGMNPTEIATMMELIGKIKDRGITIILVEHNMKAVMGLSDSITVLSYGEKIAEGSPAEIQNNRDVVEAYLGGDS
jgi:branched-chain amino acid transport system ATP-binding protein